MRLRVGASFKNQVIGGLVGVLLVASGCQTVPPGKASGLDNSGFMTLWETYTHCKSTVDLHATRVDMSTLTEAALMNHRYNGFVLPMPVKLERLVTTPATRLSVDVRAMAASCSLHAGQVALGYGRVDLAREAFAEVLTLHAEEGTSSFYLAQAKNFLAEIENGVQVSLKTP